ncbi:FAD dependent oxidoreductase [Xylariomycetidae sp. FL2044]|nr:FAD dependent oxidoreductase [Xylariomycetidae sp. FL2044]
MDKSAPILVLGAGTFGLSTAYHLAKAGYSDITVLEKSATIPPKLSAGNDLNKIIRAEYEDPFYTDLALQAMEAWKSPLFAPYYHEVGYLLCTSAAAPEKARRSHAVARESISARPAFRGQIVPVETRDDIKKIAPAFDGPMRWTGYFNRFAGYAHAADALTAAYSACCALGVKFRLGEAARSLTYTGDTCTGVVTATGERLRASLTVSALGASTPTVLPEIGQQLVARAWPVAHIQLTPAEAAALRGIPVTYARDLGFFFEPDRRTNLLKLCPSGAGYTNYTTPGPGAASGGKLSVPPEDNGFIHAQDEAMIRRLLRETLPSLADRPLINQQICWCADTADSEYIIDYVPGKEGLMVVSGDSGHAFKMLPVIGQWVTEAIAAGKQSRDRWRWKQGSNAAGEVSWRVGKSKDLSEMDSKIRAKL